MLNTCDETTEKNVATFLFLFKLAVLDYDIYPFFHIIFLIVQYVCLE